MDPVPDPPPVARRPPRRRGLLTGLLALGGLVATFLLLSQDVFGPLVVAAVGAVLVWPLRAVPAARPIVLALGLVVGAYLVARLGGVLAPFPAVFVLAYLLDPAVTAAQRRGVPRWATTAALTAAAVGALVAAAVFAVPALLEQLQALSATAIAFVQRLPAWASRSEALAWLDEAGVVEREVLAGELAAFLPGQIEALAARVPALVAGAARQLGTVLGLVTTVALLPVLLFYMLKDFPDLSRGLVSLLPRYRGRRDYLDRAGAVFGSYVRGQLLISAASAVLVAVPLALLGAPFSLVLGLVAGLLNFIPSLGSILTYLVGVLLMLAFGTLADVAIVVGVLAAQAVVEQAFLTPNIMGKQVDLHPVVILVALFASGALFGVLGLLLAVPGAALLAGAVRAYREALVLDLAEPESAPAGA